MVKSSSVPYRGNELVNSSMESHTAVVHPVKSFVLKSNTEFASRSSNVFNELNSLEKDHTSWIAENETHKPFEFSDMSNVSTSDVFKKPFTPAPRKRKPTYFPYKRNMKRWVKYSLKDIPISSDATNTAVAFQFLNELKKRKEENIDDEMIAQDEKVTFRKPTKRCTETCNSNVTSSITSKKVDKCNSQSSGSFLAEKFKNFSSNVKLDHLQGYSDD